MVRLTVKERIVLHLLELSKYGDELEVPPAMSQEGVAQAAWIDLPHFAQYVRPLIREGLVRERMAHVRGVAKRRKVYDLTDAGKMQAIRLREKVKLEVVRVREDQGVRDTSLSQVLQGVGGKASLLDILRQAKDTGSVDLRDLRSAVPGSFVEMLADSPRAGTFVGRRAELDEITREGEGSRIIVVRGMAGIGKTSLAVQACQFFRGKRNLFWHRVRPWDTRESILSSMGGFLAMLGRPGLRSVLARGESAKAAQVFREDLSGTKSLLVFDDAHEATAEALTFFRLLLEATAAAADVRALVLTRTSLSFYDRRDVVLEGFVREMDLAGLEPQDVAAYLVDEWGKQVPAGLGRRIRGHPLLLELVRAHRAIPSQALRDVSRFIEEEIYSKLTEPERKMMKLASLYETAVPREALFGDPTWSHDLLLSLSNRSLLRPVGEERFEVHDTIRGSFASLLTPSERRQFGTFAVERLRRLAAEALDRRDFSGCVNYLSNALRLSTPPEEQEPLWEALGDVNQRIGDLTAISLAYREAMKATVDPEVLARLHRKMASALEDRGDIRSASDEVDAGFQALGDAHGIERGWLNLIRCRVATARDEIEEAREHAEAALRIFSESSPGSGRAEALLAMGIVASVEGEESEGKLMAEQYFDAALDLATKLPDPVLMARIHLEWTEFLGLHVGDFQREMSHLRAVEALAGAMDDLNIRAWFFAIRGWAHEITAGDIEAAAPDYAEAMRIALKVRDTARVARMKFYLAGLELRRGKGEDAASGFEQTASDCTALGLLPLAVSALYWAGISRAVAGDAAGFRRAVSAMAQIASGEEPAVHFDILQALDRLIDGDSASALLLLERVAHTAEKHPVGSEIFILRAGHARFCYAVGLRVIGRTREAEEQMKRALDARRMFAGLRSRDAYLADRLTEGLRHMQRS